MAEVGCGYFLWLLKAVYLEPEIGFEFFCFQLLTENLWILLQK